MCFEGLLEQAFCAPVAEEKRRGRGGKKGVVEVMGKRYSVFLHRGGVKVFLLKAYGSETCLCGKH